MVRVLLLGFSEGSSIILQGILQHEKHSVDLLRGYEEGVQYATQLEEPYDIVIISSHIHTPAVTEFLEKVRERFWGEGDFHFPAIICCLYRGTPYFSDATTHDIKRVVEWMRLGASDVVLYFQEYDQGYDEIVSVVNAIAEKKEAFERLSEEERPSIFSDGRRRTLDLSHVPKSHLSALRRVMGYVER